jgi:signal transduction histidine kinase/CheY-like chemotaxis protein
VVFFGILIQLFLTNYFSQKAIFEQESKSALNILSTLKNFVNSKHSEIEDFREFSLEKHKETLLNIVSVARNNVEYYYDLYQQGKLSEAQAKRYAINSTRNMLYGNNDYIFISDYNSVLISHPDDELFNADFSEVQDVKGNLIVPPLVEIAKTKGKGFHKYYWRRYKGSEVIEKLSYVENFEPWDWAIGTGVYIDDVQKGVEQRFENMVAEIREYFKNMKLGKSGYSYIFNEDGDVLVHPNPTLEGGTIKGIKTPKTGLPLMDELKKASQKEWGENYVTYYWDKPEDIENYKYKKISYVYKMENLDWYISSTLYYDDLHSLGHNLSTKAAIIGLIMMLFIITILNILIKNNIVNPINSILAVINEIQEDNYEKKIETESEDEIGTLAGRFNEMIELLHIKDKVNKEYAHQLELMNKNLEKKVEERTFEIANKNVELTIKQRQLQKAYEHLKQLDQLKSDFLSSVSHELRTPLTSILGFAKIIKKNYNKLIDSVGERITEPKLKRYIPRIEGNLKIIIQEGERLTRLINDVLDISKIESGKMQWNEEKLDMNRLLQEIIDITRGFFVEKADVEFLTDIEENLGEITIDKDRITQVVNNLISNSIKFTEEGYVKLRAFRKNGSIQIEVEDTGEGISEEDQEQIFEKFKQVGDTLTNKPKGTGLGLPICKEIVEHYGGRIWVKGEPGDGSCFKFILPKEPDKPIEDSEPKEQLIHEEIDIDELLVPPELEKGNHRRILVVDDEESVRKLLSQILQEHDYQVIQAKNGEEAIIKARIESPDLILCDIMMPGLSGYDVIKILNQDKITSKIPVIVVSIIEDKEKGLRLGIEDYFLKPIDETKLVERISEILENNQNKIMLVEQNPEIIERMRNIFSEEFFQLSVESEVDNLNIEQFSPDILMVGLEYLSKDLVKTSENKGIKLIILDDHFDEVKDDLLKIIKKKFSNQEK